jgi:hypothetical protein
MSTSSNVSERLTTSATATVTVSNGNSHPSKLRFCDDPSDAYPQPASTTTTTSTGSIPITHNSSSLRRTASETQLSEDEAEADYKDFLFYSRVVNGIISKQHSFYEDGSLKQETQQCLESIVRARHNDGFNGDEQHHPHGCDCLQDQDELQQQLVSPVRKQLGQYYYYATSSSTTAGESNKHPTPQQRMLRFATRALILSDPRDCMDDHEEGESHEEGIFDLEL